MDAPAYPSSAKTWVAASRIRALERSPRSVLVPVCMLAKINRPVGLVNVLLRSRAWPVRRPHAPAGGCSAPRWWPRPGSWSPAAWSGSPASGLGCPTWPQCVPGSYVPVAHQPQAFHKYIEFGNRMLTFVARPRRARCVWSSCGGSPAAAPWCCWPPAGSSASPGRRSSAAYRADRPEPVTVARALPGLDGAHRGRPGRLAARPGRRATARRTLLVRRELRWLASSCWSGSTGVVLVLGTLVTGSGPHSGDANAPARYGLRPRARSRWLHADAGLLFVGLLRRPAARAAPVDAPRRPAQRAGSWSSAVDARPRA